MLIYDIDWDAPEDIKDELPTKMTMPYTSEFDEIEDYICENYCVFGYLIEYTKEDVISYFKQKGKKIPNNFDYDALLEKANQLEDLESICENIL